VTAAEEAVETDRLRIERLEPQLRRFARSLSDLGLIDLVGAGWAHIGKGDTTLEFGSLSLRAFDRLVCRLEDIAAGLPVQPRPVPGANQLRLDLTAVARPAGRRLRVSSVHPSLPR